MIVQTSFLIQLGVLLKQLLLRFPGFKHVFSFFLKVQKNFLQGWIDSLEQLSVRLEQFCFVQLLGHSLLQSELANFAPCFISN